MSMKERIREAMKDWRIDGKPPGEATLSQISGKIDYEFGSEEAVEFYEALDGLVGDGTLIYDGVLYRERSEG